MNILESLNEEQLNPAVETEGAVLVTAGAGSGKTRLLTHRIAHLVLEKGVAPSSILAITFTNKAANEMKERLSKMVDVTEMWISTFHSMCGKILRIHAPVIGFSPNFTIYGDEEKERLVKRIISSKGKEINVATVTWHISQAKNKIMSPEEYYKMIAATRDAREICEIFGQYDFECQKNNAMDFDDMLLNTLKIFKQAPEIAERYSKKFKYIHVDEFQDTNKAQYEIIKILAHFHKNIFAVGDEDQCIYTWRGAEVSNMKDFEKDFGTAKVFKLERNYRSTKKILEPANKLIEKNKNRHDKKLWTDNEEGENVTEFVAYSDIEEAEYVAKTIKEITASGKFKNKDVAILMRVNALSRILEEKLLTYGISHQVFGGFKFFERKEIKDTLAYLRVLVNPQDNDAILRVLGFPKKGIGEKSALDLYLSSKENNKSMFELISTGENLTESQIKKFAPVKNLFNELKIEMENLPIDKFAVKVIEKAGIREAIGNKTEDEITRQMNVDDLVRSISQFVEANEDAKLSDYLESVTLMRDIDNMDDLDNKVTIMTVHSAKGLEFPVVFIVGLIDGLFPISRAVNSGEADEMEEERRLMYVAITRAKQKLFLTRSKTRFSFETRRVDVTRESRFLFEMRGAYKTDPIDFKTNLLDNKFRFRDDEGTGAKYFAVNRPVIVEKKVDADKFQKGDRVRHSNFGEGIVTIPVTDPATGHITVKFDKVGIKTLSLKFAPLEKIE